MRSVCSAVKGGTSTPKSSLAGKWDNMRHELLHLIGADRHMDCFSKLKDVAIELRMIFPSSTPIVYQVPEPSDQSSDEPP